MTAVEKTADVVGKFPSFVSGSPDRTSEMGELLSSRLYGGLLILLYGDLGAGKTHLTKAMGRALGVDSVRSPSFAIETIHKLPGKNFSFVHADLYRIDDSSSVTPQFEEYLDDGNIVVVEWAERWKNPPRQDRWDISIHAGENGRRLVDFSAFGPDALGKLSEAYAEMMDKCR